MDRKKALYVREPFLIKLKAKDQPQHPINHRLMEQVDPQTVSAKKGKPFASGTISPLRKRKPGKEASCPEQKQIWQQRKIVRRLKAAVIKSEETEKVCLI